MIMRKKPITVGGSTIGNKNMVSNSTLYRHEERASARPTIVPKIALKDRKTGDKIASMLIVITTEL